MSAKVRHYWRPPIFAEDCVDSAFLLWPDRRCRDFFKENIWWELLLSSSCFCELVGFVVLSTRDMDDCKASEIFFHYPNSFQVLDKFRFLGFGFFSIWSAMTFESVFMTQF